MTLPSSRITPAFSCGARSAFKPEVRNYLRSMLSRRQLQGFVIPLHIVAGFQLPTPEPGSAALFKSFKSRRTKQAPRRACWQTFKSRAALTGFQIKGRGITPAFNCGAPLAFKLNGNRQLEKHAIAPSVCKALLCAASVVREFHHHFLSTLPTHCAVPLFPRPLSPTKN